MFLGGEYQHTLDGKRRVFIPARLRSSVARFVLTRGLEGCVSLYTEGAWKKLLEKLQNLPVANKSQARAFKRLLISGATLEEVDGQGRLLVPESLGRYAGIRKDVMIIGMDTHIEIWSSEKWNKYRRSAESYTNRIAEQIDL
ncbi:MAG TPA: division/cell wall cluster transcriptional repressor MraZ [Elusimicrobiota bacterium]|nr:division/cell wall cluster transcriptional repressor MraZ [Elusimicrobiota bacterium]